VFETFPDALVEDPAVSDDIQDLLAANADRLSWDAPIQGVADLRDSPFEPNWCTITPSRFGTVQSLFETIEYCNDQGISMYGGGQFELCVGRGHIQLLASLFYPDGPNDVAPRAYNEPEVRTELIESPSSHPQTRTDWSGKRSNRRRSFAGSIPRYSPVMVLSKGFNKAALCESVRRILDRVVASVS